MRSCSNRGSPTVGWIGGDALKWPQLVPSQACCTPITVQLQTGLNLDGTPKQETIFEGKCNYSEKSRQVMNAERQLIQLNACALIPGDIAPGRDIAGEVVIRGAGAETVRVIYSASRARNPDGTVNYTQLELV